MSASLPHRLDSVRRVGFAMAVSGLGACALGAHFHSRQFYISYLTGYNLWLGISLGCLGVTMLHHLTRSHWGFMIQRALEAGFMTLPAMAPLFVPVIFGLSELYPWARPESVAGTALIQGKVAYLNPAGFTLRALAFFLIWLLLAFYLRRWSVEQDRAQDLTPTVRLRTLSAMGIVLYPLTGTFAAVDWVMSVEPEWSSTMFPLIVLIGQVLSALALATVTLAALRAEPAVRSRLTRSHFLDLGNLLLAFTMFWTYVSFSQLLIVYSGNQPAEIHWYLHRIAGGWKWVAGLLAGLYFLLPFFLLLFRVTKQKVTRLASLAGWMLVMHAVAVWWTIQPSFFFDGIHFHWLDAATVLGLGGVWTATFATMLKRRSLLPQKVPGAESPTSQPAHAN